MKLVRSIGVIVAAGVVAANANAGAELQFDVNSLTASAPGVFSTSYTGTITLSDDGTSSLTDMLINGTAQNIAAGQLTDFSGSITIVGGVVTGGSFTLEANGTETYTASIVSGSGSVGTSAGATGPFTIDGLTFMGSFSGLTGGTDFAGVDVSKWDVTSSGSFLEFKYAGGTDTDSDIDIFVVVPMPAAASLGAVGLVGLVGVRRRR